MMTSLRFFPTLLAAVITACLVMTEGFCNAFAPEHRIISTTSRFQLQPRSTPHHSSSLNVDQDQAKSCSRTWRQRYSRQDTMLLHYGKNNDNDNSNNDEKTTVIEDGSPLGVAIVAIGGLLVIRGDLDFPFWAVAVTASVAAGFSRVIKYLRNKDN